MVGGTGLEPVTPACEDSALPTETNRPSLRCCLFTQRRGAHLTIGLRCASTFFCKMCCPPDHVGWRWSLNFFYNKTVAAKSALWRLPCTCMRPHLQAMGAVFAIGFTRIPACPMVLCVSAQTQSPSALDQAVPRMQALPPFANRTTVSQQNAKASCMIADSEIDRCHAGSDSISAAHCRTGKQDRRAALCPG